MTLLRLILGITVGLIVTLLVSTGIVVAFILESKDVAIEVQVLNGLLVLLVLIVGNRAARDVMES